MRVAAPPGNADPWEGGAGTFDFATMATGRIIDTIIDAISAFPDLIQKLAEWFGIVVDKVFAPIRAIRDILGRLEHGLLLVAAGVLAYWWHARSAR